jgi:hypothetical protein
VDISRFRVDGLNSTPLKSQRSLFKDMFGTDHSILALALDSHWASPEQRELALQVLSGTKSLSTLTTAENEVLDEIVHSYNDSDRPTGTSVQSASERLSIPAGDEHGQNMQPTGDTDLRDQSTEDGPDFSGAYGWLDGGGGK